jgi:transcriptional regulator with XRE-family HTH domain
VIDLEDICKLFGQNVRKYREAKGLSQEKLAELSRLHRTYISAVERGKRSISLINIGKISNALDIEPNKLFIF